MKRDLHITHHTSTHPHIHASHIKHHAPCITYHTTHQAPRIKHHHHQAPHCTLHHLPHSHPYFALVSQMIKYSLVFVSILLRLCVSEETIIFELPIGHVKGLKQGNHSIFRGIKYLLSLLPSFLFSPLLSLFLSSLSLLSLTLTLSLIPPSFPTLCGYFILF
jgi:hypothetical protein